MAIGLWLLAWVVPVGSLRGMILPIQYLWAMSFFSQIGWPDDLNGLSAWEGTVNHATRRAINSTLWLSVTFSLLLLLPTLLRQGIVAWPLLGWAIMLPVVSLMLGQLTKSGPVEPTAGDCHFVPSRLRPDWTTTASDEPSWYGDRCRL